MKTILSFQRVALVAVALGTASITATFAQSTNSAPTNPTCTAGGKHHHLGSVLTADEIAQLKKAHQAALAADPSLKTDQDNLKQQFEALKGQGKNSADKDQRKALFEQAHAFHQKLQAAELKIDPTLAPIFAKLATTHHGHHHSESSSDNS